MIIRKSAMRRQVRSNMKGGIGDVSITHLVEPEDTVDVRFVGEMTLPPGASIGDHVHAGETEYYLIAEGLAIVVDDGQEQRVGKGDVIVTGHGASHSIRNAGRTPLKVIAFIVTH